MHFTDHCGICLCVNLVKRFMDPKSKFPERVRNAVKRLVLGAGRVHGEGIEGSWGEAKQFDWNWLKAQKLTNFVSTQYTRQKSAAARKLEYFLSLSIFNGRQRVDEWNGMSTDPVLIGKEWHSVYCLKAGKVPTQASVYQQLLSRELAQESIADERADTPTSLFINMGMKLESKQRSIVAAVKSKDTPQDIELQRHRLSVDIKRWRGLQEEIMLPAVMTLYRLTNLADLESKLREGEAHDALESLRDRIKHSQALRSHKNDKKNFVVGIMEVDTKISGHIAKYRHARLAMIALGRSTADPGFPELKGDDDTYYKDVNTPNALNDGGRTEGWIWTIGRAGDLTDAERAEYAEDASRVQWFRARADMQHFQEEVEILAQEFRNATCGFTRMNEVWTCLATDAKSSHGAVAYAMEKASMFSRMAEECRAAFIKVGGTWPADGTSLANHIRDERPQQTVDWSTSIEIKDS
ncbi:hypothetical protein C8J57DRAFT_1612056 [Mycena rebaudengoi]|nr:hypothetical protein C8J57DRAFT_1612056 [Mycena rebaudengoi]